MSIKLSKLLQPERIRLQLQSLKRTEAIHETANLLVGHPDITNFNLFYDELLERERVESTCIGNGVAFPHARTDHLKAMVLAVGRSREGVWFENSNQTVNLIFVIGTPKKLVTDYLSVVGSLARLLKDEDLRKKLIEAESLEKFIKPILDAEARL